MSKTELATKEQTFNLVTGFEEMDEELREEFMDEMQDLDEESGIYCRTIKIPSGGGKAFEVETDDPEDPDVEKEVEGIILFTHRCNAYWEGEMGNEDSSRVPTCTSPDGKTGVVIETGEIKNCATCSLNQFAEDGSGKACKNIRKFYLLLSGRPELYVLNVPPTSIRDINKQLSRIMGSTHLPYTKIVVRFKLEAAKSKSGINYSKVTMEKAGVVGADIAAVTMKMREEIKSKYQIVQMPEEPAVKDDGFVEVEEGNEELPFPEVDNAIKEQAESLDGFMTAEEK